MHRHVWKVIEQTREPSTLDKMLAANIQQFSNAWDNPSTVVLSRCVACDTEKVYRV